MTKTHTISIYRMGIRDKLKRYHYLFNEIISEEEQERHEWKAIGQYEFPLDKILELATFLGNFRGEESELISKIEEILAQK